MDNEVLEKELERNSGENCIRGVSHRNGGLFVAKGTERRVPAPQHWPNAVNSASLACVRKRYGNCHIQIPAFKFSLQRKKQESSHLDSFHYLPLKSILGLQPFASPGLDSLSPRQGVQAIPVPKHCVSMGFLAQTQQLLTAACLHPDGLGHRWLKGRSVQVL